MPISPRLRGANLSINTCLVCIFILFVPEIVKILCRIPIFTKPHQTIQNSNVMIDCLAWFVNISKRLPPIRLSVGFFRQIKGNAFAKVIMVMFGSPNLCRGLEFAANAKRVKSALGRHVRTRSVLWTRMGFTLTNHHWFLHLRPWKTYHLGVNYFGGWICLSVFVLLALFSSSLSLSAAQEQLKTRSPTNDCCSECRSISYWGLPPSCSALY